MFMKLKLVLHHMGVNWADGEVVWTFQTEEDIIFQSSEFDRGDLCKPLHCDNVPIETGV